MVFLHVWCYLAWDLCCWCCYYSSSAGFMCMLSIFILTFVASGDQARDVLPARKSRTLHTKHLIEIEISRQNQWLISCHCEWCDVVYFHVFDCFYVFSQVITSDLVQNKKCLCTLFYHDLIYFATLRKLLAIFAKLGWDTFTGYCDVIKRQHIHKTMTSSKLTREQSQVVSILF